MVDRTGLEGAFDLTLSVKEFNLDDPTYSGNYKELKSAFLDYFSGVLEKHYGLKLERRKLPIETLVIDRANRVPTEN